MTSRPMVLRWCLAQFVVGAAAVAVGVTAQAASPAGAPAACRSRPLDFDVPDAGWRPMPLSKRKKETAYEVVREGDRSVLRARADGSASLYVARLRSPMGPTATLAWDWKTDALVAGADNRDRRREDAPLRVIVAFDGDASRLSSSERAQRKLARSLSGVEPPYATLMYLWSDFVPPETILPSAHTGQLKMVVVASGAQGLGAWQSVRRDLVADYRRAYGAEPGPLLGVAVLTDADNTGGRAEGRYANLRLQCQPP